MEQEPMVRTQHLSVNERLLRRFYEPLVLLSVLDPTRGAHRPDFVADRGLQSRGKLWRSFLDQLSFLCDAEKGGETVTAIAAQRTVDSTVFWVASNSTAGEKAKRHVIWILSQLNLLHGASEEVRQKVKHVVLAHCTRFSRRRIQAYASFITHDIERLQAEGFEPNNEDIRIWQALKFLQTNRGSPLELCTYAHELRSTDIIHTLHERHISHEARGPWSNIRHNIGRLGCWHKAVRVLLETIQIFPQWLEGAAVNLVLTNGPANVPTSRDDFDLERLVNSMTSRHERASGDELVRTLHELDSISPWMTRYCSTYATFEPRPHAELLVLEYFFDNDIEFVLDDRYIGCSKPSCYCCNLYMRVHPGRFEQRACHGNLWSNWAPPKPLPHATRNEPDVRPQRPQDHLTFKMLQDMVVHIRADLKGQILSRRPRRDRLPDSSTGMSSVVFYVTPQQQRRPRPNILSCTSKTQMPANNKECIGPVIEIGSRHEQDDDSDEVLFFGRRR